jgi:DNA primase
MTTADERLAPILFKIDRAKKHIADLDADRKAFLDTRPYAVGAKRDPQTRKPIYYVTKVDPTPIALAATIGDIIQNLRSALDHLAYQLFLVGTAGSAGAGRRVYFPIARDAAEYKKDSARKVKGLRQDALDAIDANPRNCGR